MDNDHHRIIDHNKDQHSSIINIDNNSLPAKVENNWEQRNNNRKTSVKTIDTQSPSLPNVTIDVNRKTIATRVMKTSSPKISISQPLLLVNSSMDNGQHELKLNSHLSRESKPTDARQSRSSISSISSRSQHLSSLPIGSVEGGLQFVGERVGSGKQSDRKAKYKGDLTNGKQYENGKTKNGRKIDNSFREEMNMNRGSFNNHLSQYNICMDEFFYFSDSFPSIIYLLIHLAITYSLFHFSGNLNLFDI